MDLPFSFLFILRIAHQLLSDHYFDTCYYNYTFFSLQIADSKIWKPINNIYKIIIRLNSGIWYRQKKQIYNRTKIINVLSISLSFIPFHLQLLALAWPMAFLFLLHLLQSDSGLPDWFRGLVIQKLEERRRVLQSRVWGRLGKGLGETLERRNK